MSDYALAPGSDRFAVRRRRFVLVAIVALAALAVALGISFTADTGTQTTSVTAGTTSPLVFTSSTGMPANLTFRISGTQTPTLPSWTPVAGAAGTVTAKGDLALIDGRTASAGGAGNLTISVYATNLAALQKDYSAYALPIRLYSGTFDGTTTTWTFDNTNATEVTATKTTYLTNTGGYVHWSVPTGTNTVYALQMGEDTTTANSSAPSKIGDGGSFYTISTTAGTLNPTFFITAQAS
jgi:hypothetical protein